MCLKYFVEAGAMAVRRVLKKDLKRIAKASGGMSSANSQVWRFMFLYVTMSLYMGVSVLSSFKNNLLFLLLLPVMIGTTDVFL